MRRSCRPTRAAVWLRCRPPRAGQHHGGTCAVGKGLRRPVRHVKPRAHASATADGGRRALACDGRSNVYSLLRPLLGGD
eukprot:4554802-Pleurochrysis_carterae.AAC.1